MRREYVLCAIVGFLFCVSQAHSQGAVVVFSYFSEMPLELPGRCPCNSDNPIPDGMSVCACHDIDMNGPDVGDSTWMCWANGDEHGFISPSIELPEEDVGAHTYLIISNACCWYTNGFVIIPGPQEIILSYGDFNCLNEACPAFVDPPSAPTNVQASDDTLCMAVLVSWEHDGQDVMWFNIYRDSLIVASIAGGLRTTLISVATAAQYEFSVGAANPAGESRSNGESGSSFRLKFANGPEGDISGERLAGSEFTIQFDLPVATPEECRTVAALVLLSNGEYQGVLCFDSLVTQMTCQFPDTLTESLTNCRIALLTFDMDNEFGHDNTDTTESTFTLVPLAAGRTPELPGEFSIAANYPNPFNSSTQIVFKLPQAGAVSVDIYDILGQHVTTLAKGTYAPGAHTLVWDARHVSSGVYLCRASSGGITLTRKLLLLR